MPSRAGESMVGRIRPGGETVSAAAGSTRAPGAQPDRRVGVELAPLEPTGRPLPRDRTTQRVVAVVGVLAGLVWVAYRATTFLGEVFWPAALVLYAGELLGFVAFLAFVFDAWRLPPAVRPVASGYRPTVDVLVPIYNEPVDVVRGTLIGALEQDYEGEVRVWLCDDGRRDVMRELAEELGVGYLTRSDNEGAKAGNVNAALTRTDGELVTILDADMVAQPGCVSRLVPYFADPEVALVQTPHDFYNRDSFQHHAEDRHEQSLFYDVLQWGKDRHGSTYWCGTGGILRREALEGIGGVAEQTITEDFHSSVRLHAAGWRSRYHPEPLSYGLAPTDLEQFIVQRDRWGAGNIGLLRTSDSPLTVPGLRPRQRLSYLATLVSILAGLRRTLFIVGISLVLVTGRLPFEADTAVLLTLLGAAAAGGVATVLVLGRGRVALGDLARGELLTLPAQLSALRMLVFGSRASAGFRVTEKDGPGAGSALWRTARPFVLLTVGFTVCLLIGSVRQAAGIGLPRTAAVVTFAVASWEAAQLAVAWRHAATHQIQRARFRVPVGDLEVSLRDAAGRRLAARVVDLSPTGAGLRVPASTPTVGATVTLVLASGEIDSTVVRSEGDRIGLRFDHVPVGPGAEIDRRCYIDGALGVRPVDEVAREPVPAVDRTRSPVL